MGLIQNQNDRWKLSITKGGPFRMYGRVLLGR